MILANFKFTYKLVRLFISHGHYEKGRFDTVLFFVVILSVARRRAGSPRPRSGRTERLAAKYSSAESHYPPHRFFVTLASSRAFDYTSSRHSANSFRCMLNIRNSTLNIFLILKHRIAIILKRC